MAAISELPLPRVVDLRLLRASDLIALLDEEVSAWDRQLHWDFSASADLVKRFVEVQSLSGYALLHANRIIGYIYYVCEERKGLIGDMYITAPHRSVQNENLLLHEVLKCLFETPFLRRVESQLLMASQPGGRPVPMARRAEAFERQFMEAPLTGVGELPPLDHPRVAFEAWHPRHQDGAAQVIAASYRGHVDSRINDQYRSAPGASRFLMNIVQHSGCGEFFGPGSWVALDRQTGRMCGICLASIVNPGVGHITQICLTPDVRGTGAGYELMRRALVSLAIHGCGRVTLTVTRSNQSAIALYERLHFETIRSFSAYVWELPETRVY